MGTAHHDERGYFKPGNTASVGKGRPKGSKNGLAEAFLRDLKKEWQKSGAEAVRRFAEDDPGGFCRVVASLVPKEVLLGQAGGGSVTISVCTGVPPAEESGVTIDQSELDAIHEPLTRQRPNALPIERTAEDRAAMRKAKQLRDS